MSLTPRDLKDITDLVSRKLEMYLNIDERERQFNTEGYCRSSPRMHKYDVMYRLLENAEYEKRPKKTPEIISLETPRSTIRNSKTHETASTQTPRSRLRNSKVQIAVALVTPRSRSRNSKIHEAVALETSRLRSRNDKTPTTGENKSARSRSQTGKTSGQRSNRSKTPQSTKIDKPKSNTSAEIRKANKTTKQSENRPDRFVLFNGAKNRRPISIKTPRTTKQSQRLEQIANQVYDDHPVKDLQKLHTICPRIPNNRTVQNYTRHVGAALNTKNYLDFYLKTGKPYSIRPIDNHPATHALDTGSERQTGNDRCNRDQEYSSVDPEDDSSRAVVKFISPIGSDQSELNYKVVDSRDDSNEENNFTKHSLEDRNGSSYQNYLSEDNNKLQIDPGPDEPEFIQRCKSRISRRSCSLNLPYDSNSDDSSTPKTTNGIDKTSETSTRTNSPASTRESLDTPSSYQEIDSSDSSDSSVLRYYKLSTQSTGSVHSPRLSRDRGSRYDNQRDRNPRHTPSSKDRNLRSYSYKRKEETTPYYDKMPKYLEHNNVKEYSQRSKSKEEYIDTPLSSRSTPRYTLTTRPSPRLMRRSSIRSNSITDDSNESPRSSTPIIVDRPTTWMRHPKTFVGKLRERKLIDLNMTDMLQPEKSEVSVTGTGVLGCEEHSNSLLDDEVFERANFDITTDSRQSRGEQFDDSDHMSPTTSREEYYMLDKKRSFTLDSNRKLPTVDCSVSSHHGIESPSCPQIAISPREENCFSEDINKVHNINTYTTADTMELQDNDERSATFNNMECPCNEDFEYEQNVKSVLSSDELSLNTDQEEDKQVDELSVKSEESSKYLSTKHDESLSRGSDGLGKDGRGNGGRRSATFRPSSRGSQWEDERPKSSKGGLRYKSSGGRDERGDYQILPENRGISAEKSLDEGGPEYYIITRFEPEEGLGPKSGISSDCAGGIPPKSRFKSGTQILKSTPTAIPSNDDKDANRRQNITSVSTEETQQSGRISSYGSTEEETRGNADSLFKLENVNQLEIYKAMLNLKEIQVDLAYGESKNSDVSSPELERVEMFNFVPGVDLSSASETRGKSDVNTRESLEVSVITKSLVSPVLETQMVFDLQEEASEFRGKPGSEVATSSDGQIDDKENVLSRGLSRASSVTSTLSWSDKYSFGKQMQEPVSDMEGTQTHGTRVRQSDEPNSSNLNEAEIHSEGENTDDSTGHRVEDLFSQLERLVKAKAFYLDNIQTEMEETSGSNRGENTDDGVISEPVEREVQIENSLNCISGEMEHTYKLAELPHIVQETQHDHVNSINVSTEQTAASEADKSVSVNSVSNTDQPVLTAREIESSRLHLYQSSFMETALGISGDAVKCVGTPKVMGSTTAKNPKEKPKPLTSRDITVLNSPCLAVSKLDSGKLVDLKISECPKIGRGGGTTSRHASERGNLKQKSRRPKSAHAKSSGTKINPKRKKLNFNVYFSS